MIIQSKSFTSKQSGPHILFFGRIHGDEPCGTLAIEKIIEEIETDQIVLEKGQVTFVPICNPEAASQNIRYIDENLNRIFTKHIVPSSYEQNVANLLTNYIDQCDILVDCHSGHTQNAYFVFQDYDTIEYKELAQASGIPTIISGRPNLYKDTGDMDTVTYACLQNKPGIVIEGGQHDDPASVDRTYNAIRMILHHYCSTELQKQDANYKTQKNIHMEQFFYKDKEGDFAKDYIHGEQIHAGDVIVRYEDGSALYAEEDCVIILPKHYASVGEEWFYIGKIVS